MKHALLFTLLCLFIANPAFAQHCGTEPTIEQIKYLDKTKLQRQNFDPSSMKTLNTITWLPIQFHDVRTSSGNNGNGEIFYMNMINALNAEFLSYDVQFYECSFFNTINDNIFYNFNTINEPVLSVHDVLNVINIYFMGTVTSGATPICGYSYLPPSTDKIVMSKNLSCANSTILIHEMGHYLSLYHTHGKTNTGTTDELVNGSNCTTAGDDVCDTPADPNLIGKVSGCQYTGTVLDANNQAYTPMVDNVMSYAPVSCKDKFTPGQVNRMLYAVANDRSYLNGCSHPSRCDNPISTFPYAEDFESGLGDWRNQESEIFEVIPYQGNSGSTPTIGTGPSAAASGNAYIYSEADDAIGLGFYNSLISPCIDISNLNTPTLTFQYHLTGSTNVSMVAQVSTDGGYNWGANAILWQISGDQGNQWNTASIDLTPYKNNDILQIRIAGTIVDADLALDDVQIYDASPPSCSLTLVTYSADIVCNGLMDGYAGFDILSAFTLPITAAWSNGGTGTQIFSLAVGMYTVTVTDANQCSAIHTFTINEPPAINLSVSSTDTSSGNNDGTATAQVSGGVPPYTYYWSTGGTSASINNLAAGNYQISIYDANGCVENASVEVETAFSCTKIYNWGWPYTHSLESGLGRFKQETVLDDKNWKRRQGPTPTNNTGPSAAKDGNYYRYLESSNSKNQNKVSIIKTKKCLNLNNISNPVFEFWYHMYGNTMGSLEVDVSLDDGITWQSIWSLSGDQGNQWSKALIDLLPYQTDHTKLRIQGTTGSGPRSDMAIDDYYIGSAGGNNAPLVSPNIILDSNFEIEVYPNPSSGIIYLESENPINLDVEVHNHLGQLVYQAKRVGNTINLSDLGSGQYFLKLIKGKETLVKHIILMK